MDTTQPESSRWTTGIIVSALIIIGLVFVFYPRSHLSTPPTNGSASSTTAGTSTDVKTSTAPSAAGDGYTVKQLPTAPTAASVPDYKAPLVCAQDVDAGMCTSLKAQAANAAAAIAKNVHDTDSWIVLGVARKEAGDYVGAAAAWQYVSAIAPTNPVSFNNLGDLYMNYLHDNAKAVSNYLTEIKNFPKSLDSYRNVFQIYTTTSYTGSATAAEDILKQGIAANPKAYDLEVLLARYYKAKGRTSDADTEYQAAAANATSQNLTDMATQIKAESAQ